MFCSINYPFNRVSWRFTFSLNKDRMETSTRARQCLNICQFKIGQGYVRKKKSKMSLHPARGVTKRVKWWECKSCSVRAPYERIGPIRARWVPGRGALLIPGGFAMEFLRSWSEPGVALRLKLRFDLSPTASHATAITHRPLISIFRPARPSRPSSPLLLSASSSRSPVLECLRYSMLLHTSDLDPIDRHELIVLQILCPLARAPNHRMQRCLDLVVMI